MLAGARGHVETAELLLSRGADETMVTDDGGTALKVAAALGRTDIVRLLLERRPGYQTSELNADVSQAMVAAAFKGDRATVGMLLRVLPPGHQAQEIVKTALMVAANEGKLEVVQTLMDPNAPIKIESKDVNGALLAATRAGHHRMVTLLIEKNPLLRPRDAPPSQ